MPDKRTPEKARKAKRAGRAATTRAGEIVREVVYKIRRGVHGTRSRVQALGQAPEAPEQTLVIGVAKTGRAGVALPPAKRSKAKARARRSAEYAYSAGPSKRTARRRPRVARAVSQTLKREPTGTASRRAPSRHASSRTSSRRTARQRSEAALKAARTKGFAGRSAAARKAARTRARNRRARGG